MRHDLGTRAENDEGATSGENRFLNTESDPHNEQQCKELGHDEPDEVPVLVPCPFHAEFGDGMPSDLAEVAAAWKTLPDAVRAGVLAMVRATRK